MKNCCAVRKRWKTLPLTRRRPRKGFSTRGCGLTFGSIEIIYGKLRWGVWAIGWRGWDWRLWSVQQNRRRFLRSPKWVNFNKEYFVYWRPYVRCHQIHFKTHPKRLSKLILLQHTMNAQCVMGHIHCGNAGDLFRCKLMKKENLYFQREFALVVWKVNILLDSVLPSNI